MSIDYDRLRTTVDVVDDPETDKITRGNYTLALEVQGPDFARELLRLHDGSAQLLAKKRAAVKRLYSTDQVTAAVLELMCDELENLLEGDTE